MVSCRSGNTTPSATSTPQGNDEVAVVRKLIDDEFGFLRQSDWQAVYEDYAPEFRSSCPYDKFEQSERASVQGLDPSKIGVTNVKVSLNGEMAAATYTYTYAGETVSAISDASPDLFVKVDSRWYDAADAHVTC